MIIEIENSCSIDRNDLLLILACLDLMASLQLLNGVAQSSTPASAHLKGKLEESSGAQIRRKITNEISAKESALMKKLQPVDIELKRKVSDMMHRNPVKSEGNREVRKGDIV